MTIEVREARPHEHATAGAVTAKAYRSLLADASPQWHAYLDDIADVGDRASRTLILIALEGDRILGSATLELNGRTEQNDDPLPPGEAHIRMLGIDPAEQGRGIGRLLMEACEARARALERTLMTLNTTDKMPVAQRMYESMGYERGEDRVFPEGFVLLSYSKRLV